MKEIDLIKRLEKIVGDNQIKDGLVKGILKRIGWFGRN